MTIRPSARLLVAFTALAAVLPSAAVAKSLCVANSANADVLVLASVKLKKGKASPVTGLVRRAATASPVSGATIVNAAGNALAIALAEGNAAVGVAAATANIGPGPTWNLGFFAFDGSLGGVGDVGGGTIGSSTGVLFTVVDCRSVAAVP